MKKFGFQTTFVLNGLNKINLLFTWSLLITQHFFNFFDRNLSKMYFFIAYIIFDAGCVHNFVLLCMNFSISTANSQPEYNNNTHSTVVCLLLRSLVTDYYYILPTLKLLNSAVTNVPFSFIRQIQNNTMNSNFSWYHRLNL